MRQKRTFFVYCSMTRRSAACAACVMASASSSTISLNVSCCVLNTLRVLANDLICPRTTSMPRSSDAFSSSTWFLNCLPYSRRASAMIVDVLPVPGGP